MNKKQLAFVGTATVVCYLVFCALIALLCKASFVYVDFLEIYQYFLFMIGLGIIILLFAFCGVLFFALALYKIYEFLGDKESE